MKFTTFMVAGLLGLACSCLAQTAGPTEPLPRRDARVAPTGTSFWPVRPRPGIYEAFPYTGIILVPEVRLDERFIIPPRGKGGEWAMPMVKRDFQLIPRAAKK